MGATGMLALLVAALPLAAAAPVAELGRGQQAFWAGQYDRAARTLSALPPRLPRTRDYALYLAAESEFYAGRPARARALYGQLAGERDSRFAPLAPWRVADCLWAEGRKPEAVAAYRRLIGAPPAGIDAVVGRFRVAELAPAAEAAKLYRQIHLEHPAHPLAAEAARRMEPETSTDEPPAADPRARLKRASVLVEGRRVDEAIAELERLPAELPPDLATERDLALGMAKFRTRHDYPAAAALLLGVAPRLKGERAASAAFHGARALLRANRTDESIAANLKLADEYPTSRWAVEAQFVAGWLEFNRGRYQESLPNLRATLDRPRRNGFADDAAWYLSLAYHFLGRHDEALAALDEYARRSGSDADAARRVAYWRGRFLSDKGSKQEGRKVWRDLIAREPLSYYGLLARARLRQAGEAVKVVLPKGPLVRHRKPPRDPALLRAEELDRAGLTADAGVELVRSEEGLEARLGREQALPVLLDGYRRFQAYRRGYQVAETRGAAALQTAPVGEARAVWEAALPRAYQPLVDRYSKAARAPSLFVYSIMRKESEYRPTVTSPADARGLLQLLPGLGAQLAAQQKMPFHDDDLYRPEVNIRLGALRIASLVKTFRGQLFLAAGAYNGGVVPMRRWLDQQGRRPLDEFLELVGFKESREYIKRVTAIYARYLYLYTGKPYELPLVVKSALKTKAPPEPPPPPPPDETTP